MHMINSVRSDRVRDIRPCPVVSRLATIGGGISEPGMCHRALLNALPSIGVDVAGGIMHILGGLSEACRNFLDTFRRDMGIVSDVCHKFWCDLRSSEQGRPACRIAFYNPGAVHVYLMYNVACGWRSLCEDEQISYCNILHRYRCIRFRNRY